MPQPINRPFLGSGWKFPLQVDPGGRIALSKYEQRVEESIYLILSTSRGERLMLPEFGCGIHDLVFEPNNDSTLALVEANVRDSLVAFEPRIDVLSIDVESPEDQPNLLLIRVDYRIRASQAVGNLVYPFYITESV
jgi:phage baseplate assembly protein W